MLIAPLRVLYNNRGSSRLFLTHREIQATQLYLSTKAFTGSNDAGVNGFISGTIAKDGTGIKVGQYAEVGVLF